MKQTDIYTEALVCLRLILQTDHPEFKNWLDWLERDIEAGGRPPSFSIRRNGFFQRSAQYAGKP